MAATAALDTSAIVAAALAIVGLPLYALSRDGFLPRLRRRD
ncbi:MAG TPA: hypothetical protein VFR97_10155 [Capillimicrobium sp.]|nr:hypothetical protein [Capillimicrobium sp.]